MDYTEQTQKLHRAQHYILANESRYKVVVSGRRFGKSHLQLVKMLELGSTPFNYDGARPTALSIAPTHPQARSILFNPFLDMLADIFGSLDVLDINRTLMTVSFGPQYPLVKFSGAHGTAQERLRGLKLVHAGVDEVQDIPLKFLEKVVYPALADLKGTVIFTGTPKGRSNTLYKLWTQQDKQFSRFSFSSYANTLIPGFRESLDELKLLLPPESFEQEILARFVDVEGKFLTRFHKGLVVSELPDGEIKGQHIGVDPGPTNRGFVVVQEVMTKTTGLIFVVVHAEMQGQNELDSEAISNLLSSSAQLPGQLRMVAVDPSRPELVTELRRNKKPGIKAINSFAHGINVLNTLFHQGRVCVLSKSAIDGSSHEWFVQQLEDYHRAKNSLGEVLDKEDNDIPTHTIDSLRYVFATLDKHTPNLLGTQTILPNRKG